MAVSLLDKYPLKKFPNRINWEITRNCNFTCPYCVNRAGGIDCENKVLSPEKISKIFNSTGREWLILITGGEPFVYPDFTAVCEKLAEKHYLQITTNMSMPGINNFADRLNPEKVFLISASYHCTEREKLNLKQDFLETCRLLRDKGFKVLINYLAHPAILNQIDTDMGIFHKEGFDTFVIVLRGTINGLSYPESYSAEDWGIMNKYLLDAEVEKKAAFGCLDFYGHYCEAGWNYFFMKPDGEISRCATLQKSLGNLFTGDYQPFNKLLPCVAHNCNDIYCGIAAVESKKACPFTMWLEKKKYFK